MVSAILGLLIFVVVATKFVLRNGNKHHKLPPSPPSLPIIGHLHLLKLPIHRTFRDLSQKYGPIFSLRFGSRPVIVASSSLAAEECFTKNDIIFANRPRFRMGKYLNYDYTSLVVADYGDHWRNLRRLCSNEIFSLSRLNALSGIRREEVKILLGRLCCAASHGFVDVNLRPMLLDLAFNVIMRMVAGKRYYGEDDVSEEARRFKEIVDEYFECCVATHLGDLFPILQSIDGHGRKLSAVGKKIDAVMQQFVDERRADTTGKTMIGQLLTLQQMQPQCYTDDIIKGLIMVMILAGTETTGTSLEWAVANLLNHPGELKKAKEEIDTIVGHDRLIEESDLSKLNCLQCIINETLRLYPVGPLLAPREASEDCELGGYHVPRGTMLFVNAWAIQRDVNLWDDPNSFKPERFENVKSKSYGLMPFGKGRRNCPGEELANRVMGLTLGSLIQCFEWDRIGGKEIDMTEKAGMTLTKLHPLLVSCKACPEFAHFYSNYQC